MSAPTIAITGASSGIGEQLALQLASRGVQLCLLARRRGELQRVQAEVIARGGRAAVCPVDLADEAALDRCIAELLAQHPRIDVLVNNAGHSIRRSICKSLDRDHDFRRLMQINYFAPLRLSRRLLPQMLARGDGHIVNVTSIAVQTATPGYAAYVASKSALEGFSRVLAAEMVDRGIGVTLVRFPLVRTPMSLATDAYRNARLMAPETAAGWILRAIDRRPARVGTLAGDLMEMANLILPGTTSRWTGRVFRQLGRLQKSTSAR